MINLIESFKNNGIQVWEENGKLRFSGPKDKINNEFISILQENKEQLLTYLSDSNINERNLTRATKNQMALWIEKKMGNTSGIIHNGMIKSYCGEINISNIKSAFYKVIERHEALRCTFYEDNGEVYIKLSDISNEFFDYEELMDMNESDAYQFIKSKMNETLELENGPLFRVGVYRYQKNKYFIGIWAHHIISDAYSLFIIEKEFYKFYDELVYNNKHIFDTAGSYLSTISKDIKYLKSERYIEDINYWRCNLDANIYGTSLPKYKILNEGEAKYIAATFNDNYTRELTRVINSFTREYNFTPYILIFSVFNLAIHFLNEGNNSSLGVFVANRMEELHLKQVGYFSNPIVFQNEIDETKSLIQYINSVKDKLVKSFSHQQIPFTSLVEEINPLRDGGAPFFNVGFDSLLFSDDVEKNELQMKLKFKDVDLLKGSAEYDLIVWISEEKGCYSLEYRYNGQLFEEYQIESLAETIKGILNDINNIKQNRLSNIQLLHGKYKYVIDNVNNTQVNLLEDNIFTTIKHQCNDQKDRLAISYENQQISYSEMENLIDVFCYYLKKKGVKRGSYVGIMLEKSYYLLPAVISLWAIGAVYVPIDPSFPISRKEYIIKNTKLAAIIKEKDAEVNIAQDISIITADDVLKEWKDSSVNDTIFKDINYDIVKFDDPAYVLYTSGSTGNPKGVVISHRAFMNFLLNMKNEIDLSRDDKILSITSICFDISLLEMFLPLITGACVVMISQSSSMNGRSILKTINSQNVTVMQATPASYEILYDYYLAEGYNHPILNVCLCGGESYNMNLVQKIQKMSNRVFNVYGPTETTIWSTIFEVPNPCYKLKIGKPINNTKVRIADKNGRDLPVGVPGELLISGVGLFKGYYNNSKLTEEVIIKLENDEIFYKTGDWAYFNQDGDLNFLGRKDSQIKIRGFRIEISEIENIFRRFDKVSNVAVITLKENEVHTLVAVVIPKDGIKIGIEELNQFIGKYLPEYMIPTHILIEKNLPMTNNNKINKKVIKEIVKNKFSTKYILEGLEESKIEKQLKTIWKKILKKEIISVKIGFFEMGGNSLLLNKLVFEMEKTFRKKIDIIELLKFNTICKMAEYLNEDKNPNKDKSIGVLKQKNQRINMIKRRK